jgi:membrane peptidoglycan carboxypeptidase
MFALMGALILLIIGGSSGSAYALTFYQQQLPKVQNLAVQQISQTTRIYDRNMVPLFNVYDPNSGGRRTPISYNQIPKVMQDAMISTEDRTFWTNIGVDPQGILRNLPSYVSGHASGGGSTLTQQLIKNLRQNAQYSLNRKLSEAVLAIGLTRIYPKWKILEMYFNVAPFGSQDLGVEAAVEDYFHLTPTCARNFQCTPGIVRLNYNQQTRKDDPVLGLARASLLAGMPQSPYEYDPTLGKAFKDRALVRQREVLNGMVSQHVSVDGIGTLTPQVVQQAESLTANMDFSRYNQAEKAPHFVNWVIGQMETALGHGDPNRGVSAFLNGGFNIRTTVDANVEQYVEDAVARHLEKPELQKLQGAYATLSDPLYNVNDAAVEVMNAQDGEVLAMDGSANYASTDPRVQGQFNAAVSPRQPGSSFKPFVYATAFQMGWYPGVVLPDVQTGFPNGLGAGVQATYVPTDYGNHYTNQAGATIRLATAQSLNIPAVKAMQFAGVDHVVNNLQRMGVTSFDSKLQTCQRNGHTDLQCFGVSMALGTTETPLDQLVSAYQTFANNGLHVPPQYIMDVWDNYGHNLYHLDPRTQMQQAVQVFSPQVAYMMTSVLIDEPSRYGEFLNDHDLSFADWSPDCATVRACSHQVAAKTGTTDNFKDNWTIGYTPGVVVGVWTGNANGESLGQDVIGITGAAPIWHSVMEFVSGRTCSAIDPTIRCPSHFDPASLGLNQASTFPIPSGIQQQCVSSVNGLAGSGSNCDWMLDGQQPQVSGVPQAVPTPDNTNNGNTGNNANAGNNGGNMFGGNIFGNNSTNNSNGNNPDTSGNNANVGNNGGNNPDTSNNTNPGNNGDNTGMPPGQ